MADEIDDTGVDAPEFTGGDDGGANSYYFGDFQDDTSQAKGYHEFVNKYGGHDNVNKIQEWYAELARKYDSDPVYRQHFDDIQSGKYPQQQAPPQQPPQPPPQPQEDKFGFTKYSKDPMFLAAQQAALMNGGVLPEQYQGRDQYQKQLMEVQSFHDRNWANPVEGTKEILQHPEIIEMIQKIAGKVVEPVQGQIKQQNDQALIAKYTPHIEALHPEVKQMFIAGEFGKGERAAIAAIKMSQMIKQNGQPVQPKGGGKPKEDVDDAEPAPRKSRDNDGKPGSKQQNARTEAEKREQARRANSSAFGRASAKAKVAELNGRP